MAIRPGIAGGRGSERAASAVGSSSVAASAGVGQQLAGGEIKQRHREPP